MSSTKVKKLPFADKKEHPYDWNQPIKDQTKFMRSFYWLGEFCLDKEFESVEIHGAENYPKEGKCIIVANHVNGMDPITIQICAGKENMRSAYFMCKSEFFQTFYLRFVLRLFNGYPVNREKPDRESIQFSKRVLDAGQILTIFPQGTRDRYRNRPSTEEGIKTGFAMIAREAKAPVLPVSIHLSSDLENHHPKCIIRYGEMIPYEELGFTEGTRKSSELRACAKMIMTKVQELWDKDQL